MFRCGMLRFVVGTLSQTWSAVGAFKGISMAMSVEELKERYKLLPVWGRLAIAFVIGFLPGIYLYFDEGDALAQKLVESQTTVQTSRGKFEDARKKKSNLPQLEEQMAYTEDQLAKAKLKLPDHIIIEDILQKTAMIAKQTGVQLTVFNPAADISHTVPYQYIEAPIATEVVGHFSQIASFFDQMIHLDGTIFMRRIELTRQDASDKARAGGDGGAGVIGEGDPRKKSAYEKAQDARQNLMVHAKFDIVVFRSLSEQERLASLTQTPANASKPKRTPPSPAADGADPAAAAASSERPPSAGD
jgi:Tfp pilus assembly protein PilO